jgi:hypothetical protein
VNDRGQYGNGKAARGRGAYRIGAQLQHVLELDQRYEGVDAAGAQALLNALAQDGHVAATGTNRWEAALRDGAWVGLAWDPTIRILKITITDRQPWPITHVIDVQDYYEKILREKITPRLQRFGAVAVGHLVTPRITPYGAVVGGLVEVGVSATVLQEESARLDGEIRSFDEDLVAQLSALTAPVSKQIKPSKVFLALRAFYRDKWTPFRNNWRAFYETAKRVPTEDSIFATTQRGSILAHLHGYQSHLIDLRSEAAVVGWTGNVAPSGSSSEAPSVPGPSVPGPSIPATSPGPPQRDSREEETIDRAPHEEANYGLYAVLGVGAIVTVAALVAFSRHAEAA